MKMTHTLVLAIAVTVLTTNAYAQDYSGTWLGTVNQSVAWCDNIGKAELGDYKLTIIQNGYDITIMENVVQRPYKGVIHPERPRKIHVAGSYAKDGGYVNELVDIVFNSDTEGSGESVWRWSDGYYQCGGRFSFALKKIR